MGYPMRRKISGLSGVLGTVISGLRQPTIVCAVLSLAASWESNAAMASGPLETQINFDIAANSPLEGALLKWGVASGMQVMMASDLVNHQTTEGVRGFVSAGAALMQLLQGSGLSYVADQNTIHVVPAKTALHLAQATRQQSADATATYPAQREASRKTAESAGDNLAEVIVTAQKREERLQDVPVPVTALDADVLVERNQSRLEDYFATVPGLSLSAAPFSGGQQSVAIRGIITSNYANPTVGVTIDDIPFGSSTALGQGSLLYPDIDPADLQRIEVLRGPQGTLYGASSIGGLIKIVTRDPSTSEFSGHVQVLGNNVDGGGTGYGVRGSVNIPLSDVFAIQASGFTRRDPGYVENVTTGQRDVNQADVSGGHLAALWRPSETVSVKLSALIQDTNGDGTAAVDTNGNLQPTLGDLRQARMPGTEGYSMEVRLYAATVNAKLGSLDFTSISGYGTNKYSELEDLSLTTGPYALPIFGVTGASLGNYFETKEFTQEFRLTSPSDQFLEWLVGAFYTHESTSSDQIEFANQQATGSEVGVLGNFDFPTTVEEYALFGDVTAHLTDRFDVQVGGRESRNRQTYNETDSGAFYDPAVTYPTEVTQDDSFTYLLTPRFRISPDFMVYARLASGYRVGGPNVTAIPLHLPTSFGPDRTYSYEVGIKGDSFSHMLTFDVSAYYIDWKNIQIYLTDPVSGSAYFVNGGRARSDGLETSIQVRPARGLSLTAVATMSDAVLAENFPSDSSAIGSDGDRLPFSSRFTGSVLADQEIPLTGTLTGSVGGTLSYVGDREGQFATSYAPVRLRMPGYTSIDLRTGARYESWTFNVFLDNVADRRGIVTGNTTQAGSGYDAIYIQPRTVGASIAKTF